MKKIMLSLAAVVLLAACAKEAQPNDATTPADENLVTYTFTAANPNEATRSTLTNAGVFTWQEGDKIAIHDNTSASNVVFEVTAVDGEGNATITADAAPGAVWTNAIYPAARAKVSGNYIDFSNPGNAPAGPVLVSKVAGQDLSFKYAGAVVNITLNDIPDTPTSLTLTANAGTPFAEYPLTWDGENPVLGTGTSATSFITVPYAGNGNVTSIPVPHHNFASGFTITVDNAAGRHLFVKSTTKAKDLTSKILLPMDAIDYTAPSAYYVTTESVSHYWDKAGVRLVQTGTDEYTIVENCDGNSTFYIFDEYNASQPKKGCLATGLTKLSYSTGTSTWRLVGNPGEFEGVSCVVAETIQLEYEGDWHFAKNVKSLKEWPNFKFVNGTENWEDQFGTKISNSGNDNNVYVGNYNQTASRNNNPGWIYVNAEADKEYDFFLNPTTGEVRVFLSSDKHDPNETSGLWKIVYDKAENEVKELQRLGNVADTPFWNTKYPIGTNAMCLSGSFNNWDDSNPFTYNGNMSWTIEGLNISSGGEYAFKIRPTSGWNDNFNSGNGAFSGRYGTLNNGGGDAPISLTAGNYNVYLNATTENKYNIMFVKQ